jgi:hypothetical protein
MPDIKANETIDKAAGVGRAAVDEASRTGQAMAGQAAEASRKGAELGRETISKGAEIAAEGVTRAADRYAALLNIVGPEAEKLAERSRRNLAAVSRANAALVKGAEDASQQWMTSARDGLVDNIGAINRVAQCRSMPDLIAVQSDLMRHNFGHTLESGRRIAEICLRASEEAAGRVRAEASA